MYFLYIIVVQVIVITRSY